MKEEIRKGEMEKGTHKNRTHKEVQRYYSGRNLAIFRVTKKPQLKRVLKVLLGKSTRESAERETRLWPIIIIIEQISITTLYPAYLFPFPYPSYLYRRLVSCPVSTYFESVVAAINWELHISHK